jgi:hypothetical protein
MENRTVRLMTVIAILLAGTIFSAPAAQAAAWKQQTAGTYSWTGILQVGDGTLTTSRLGHGDVDAAAGGTLCIKARVANAIADTATVSLGNTGDVFYGMMNLESGVSEAVGGLVLGGMSQPAGTYGSSASAATHKPDTYFSGPGILTVASQTGVTRPSGKQEVVAWRPEFMASGCRSGPSTSTRSPRRSPYCPSKLKGS